MRAPFWKTDRRRRQEAARSRRAGFPTIKGHFSVLGGPSHGACVGGNRDQASRRALCVSALIEQDKTFVTVVQVEGLSGIKSGEKGTVRSKEKKKK